MTTLYRPRSARFTAGAVVAVAVAVSASHAATSGLPEAAPTLGLAALACVVGVAAYWRPCVRVDDETVEVVNVLSTVTVPLARIVHVDTRWAMTMELDDGRKVTAFAAPAPGTSKARDFRQEDLRGLPPDTYATGSVRVGDSPGTASGDAALLVRTALQVWRESKTTDERSVTRRASAATVAALACGLVAAVGGFLI